TVSHACKGGRSDERAGGYLTDPYRFEGEAWFRRNFDVTPEMRDRELYLRLERTRMTEVYVDGEKCGDNNSLCTAHIFRLPKLGTGKHTLDIRVRNVGYPTKGGHMTSPDTQTNWLGITGAVELIIRPEVHIDDITVLSETESGKVVFSCTAVDDCEAYITISGGRTDTVRMKKGENRITYIPEQPLALWDEFSPNLHKLCVATNGEMQTVKFGIRKLETRGRKLLINDREVFLRGKHDGMIFPLTGYAPTDVESWLRVLGTAKKFGINHYRFHTCCPPDAAFTAADMLGIYMQPELPFWGTIEEEMTDEQRYLADEGSRILREFGNHPSFVMMSLGNELWGSQKVLNGILARYKSEDDRHLYTDGSNNYQFVPQVLENADFLSGVRLSRERLYRGSYAMCDAPQGFIQTDAPNTVHNYDGIIVPEAPGDATEGGKILIQYGTGVKEVEAEGGEMFIPEVPVISHEVGQYETYPDYSEIDRYTGALKAENIALYKEKAAEKGLLDYADKFFHASGALAVDCYKREIEAALKSEELSGFQLLDIQDFTGQGTALVGVLNSLMEPKGTVTAEEWREFCAPTVIMAEFEKFVFSADEDISFGITLFNTDPSFAGERVSYTVEYDGAVEFYGHVRAISDKRVNKIGKVVFRADDIKTPAVYKLTLSVEKTEIRNTYEFAVYPKTDVSITRDSIVCGSKNVIIAHTEENAGAALANGEAVVYIPDASGKLEGTYCTDFWCYPMFRSISESMNKPVPIGTMGLLIDNNDKLLAEFPCTDHTTAQWFELVMHSRCEELDGTDTVPVVWVIDNPDRAAKLGMLYRKNTGRGVLTVCTSRLWEIADKPEVKWFAKSLADGI
ncbi:MAG: hypothetical protein IK093_01830, partial [Ruminiclostridium sp.]|nr:hypothetical protein [Ruminiclostridium sp.]